MAMKEPISLVILKTIFIMNRYVRKKEHAIMCVVRWQLVFSRALATLKSKIVA